MLFLLFMAIHVAFILSGLIWVELTQGQIIFWLTLDTLGGSVAAGVLFIYSLERYKQEHLFRDLLFVMLSIDAIIAAGFYLITSPAFAGLSPFVDRNRNRVMLLFLGLIVGISPLLGSLAGESPVGRSEKIRVLFANAVVGPILASIAVFSPVQFITVASSELGPFEFTPDGLALFLSVLVVLVLSMVKSFRVWQTHRVISCLALGLMMILFITSGLLASMLTNPSTVLEVEWHFAYFAGFALISLATVMDVVIDPFRALKTLLDNRTSELDESRRESEYYLSIWSHKVGNLLQELSTYLELLTLAPNPEEIARLRESAVALVYDVQAINRQVHVLTRIKERKSKDLVSVDINAAFSVAIQDVRSRLGSRAPEITVSELDGDDSVLGDDLMGTVPFNIIMYIARAQETAKPKISVRLTETGSFITAHIEFEGRPLSSDIRASLVDTLDPSRTTMGLDIYSTKLLLKTYGGSLEYKDTPTGGRFEILVRKAQRHQVAQR